MSINILDFFCVKSKLAETGLERDSMPTTLGEMFNFKTDNIKIIKQKINSNSIFIYGGHGTGKTITTRLVLENKKIPYQFYDASCLHKNSEYNPMFRTVIDNLETVSNYNHPLFPSKGVIFICSTEKAIKYKTIMQKSDVIEFTPPSEQCILRYVTHLNKHFSLNKNLSQRRQIASQCNGDIRCAIKCLETNIIETKHSFKTLKDIFSDLIDKKCEINDFETHSLTNLFHENLPTMTSDIENLDTICDNLSISDYFENSEFHGYISLGLVDTLEHPKTVETSRLWSTISNNKIKYIKLKNIMFKLFLKRCFLTIHEFAYITKILNKKELQKHGFTTIDINTLNRM